MSLSFSSKKKPLDTFSLAGMADIVLQLLIFFLLTSSFIPQFGIQVTLPQADAAAPMQSQFVTVVITADGNYYVEQERVLREGLLEAIQDAVGDKTSLALRADQDATVAQLTTVASIAKALDLRILIATERAGLRPAR